MISNRVESSVNPNIPMTVADLKDLKRHCRICSRKDCDLINLDEEQKFSFAPQVRNYRMLFQKTSLQFQFSAMPDLSLGICERCQFQIRTFYCFTRNFSATQKAMQTSIGIWYRKTMDIEPPASKKDSERIRSELSMIENDEVIGRSKTYNNLKPILQSSESESNTNSSYSCVKRGRVFGNLVGRVKKGNEKNPIGSLRKLDIVNARDPIPLDPKKRMGFENIRKPPQSQIPLNSSRSLAPGTRTTTPSNINHNHHYDNLSNTTKQFKPKVPRSKAQAKAQSAQVVTQWR